MPGGRKPGVLAGCSVLQEFEHQLFCRAGVQRSVRSLRGQLCRGLGVPEQFSSLRLGGSRSSCSASGAFECQDASEAASSEEEVEWLSSRRMDDDSSQEEGDCFLGMERC